MLACVVVSCSKDNDPEPIPNVPDYNLGVKGDRTTLIYSVAANNLLYDLRSDSVEMLKAASKIEGMGPRNRVLLYFAPMKGKPTLSLLTLTASGEPKFEVLKLYERDMASTHPARMRAVLNDMESLCPATKYGMILESHGTGWTPAFSKHTLPTEEVSENPVSVVAFAFGSDYSINSNVSDKTDIIELANLFRDHELDFIWFDACYMSGIETIYQLRNKADRFIGYVTEIMSDGMPYDKVLPQVAGVDSDVVKGADILYRHYNDMHQPVSVAVTDMAKIPALADAMRPLARVEEIPYISFMQNYARFSNGPFYDLYEYVNLANENSAELQDELAAFNSALANAVIYKNISARDFNGNSLNTTIFSGISTHIPGQPRTSVANENYWFSTDWARDVYPTNLK